MYGRIARRTFLAAGAGIAAASVIGIPVCAQTAMRRFGGGAGNWAKDPALARTPQGRVAMYYTTKPRWEGDLIGQAVAESVDGGVSWRHAGVIGRGICAGDALTYGGKVHLFYQSYEPGKVAGICHATSSDGFRFTSVPRTPIFRPTGSWNNGRAIDAEARIWGDELLMYWATRSPDGVHQMLGVHSAPLSSNWDDPRVWRQRCTAPLLKPELPWERPGGRGCIEAPSIAAVKDVAGQVVLVMFYAGGYNNAPQQIGVAFSRDGLSWTRMSDQPFLPNGAAGTWNSSESGHPGVFMADGKTWLYFIGNNTGGTTNFVDRREIVWDGYVPQLTP